MFCSKCLAYGCCVEMKHCIEQPLTGNWCSPSGQKTSVWSNNRSVLQHLVLWKHSIQNLCHTNSSSCQCYGYCARKHEEFLPCLSDFSEIYSMWKQCAELIVLPSLLWSHRTETQASLTLLRPVDVGNHVLGFQFCFEAAAILQWIQLTIFFFLRTTWAHVDWIFIHQEPSMMQAAFRDSQTDLQLNCLCSSLPILRLGIPCHKLEDIWV